MSNSQEADRLSDLSDEILHQILLRLDLREQVATTLLSRRWRGLWARNPTFHLRIGHHDVGGRFFVQCTHRWEHPVRRLHVDFADYPTDGVPKFSDFFSTKILIDVVEHAVLEVPRTPHDGSIFLHPVLPRLKTLNLVQCHVQSIPPTSPTLPSLVSLYLDCRWVNQSVITRLFYDCPLLENLTLVNFCDLSGFVALSSPTLKTLKMHLERSTDQLSENHVLLEDLPRLQRLDVYNLGYWMLSVHGQLPSLLEANICSSFHPEARPLTPVPRVGSHLMPPDGPLLATPALGVYSTAFVFHLTNARVLQLDLEIADVLTRYLISNGARTQHAMFNQLKELHLHGSYSIGFKLIWLQIFLGECVFLEELCIKLGPPVPALTSDVKLPVDKIDELEEALERPNFCSLGHLKSARIIGLTSSRNEINLAKLILERASTIRSLELYFRSPSFDDHDDENIPVNFEEEINECFRASPGLHVMIVREPPARCLLCPKHFEHFEYY